MTKQTFILLIVLLLSASIHAAFAQPEQKGIAGGGPRGIYISTGLAVAAPDHPVGAITGYRIERRLLSPAVPRQASEIERLKKAAPSWQAIAEPKPPASLDEFTQRYRQASLLSPFELTGHDAPLEKIWQNVGLYHRLDSLKMWSGVLAIRIALGNTWLDSTAEREHLFQYRISTLDNTGKATPILLSEPVSYPQTIHLARATLSRSEGSQSEISLRWKLGKGKRPASFIAYRQFAGDSLFAIAGPERSFAVSKDTVFLVIRDTLIQPSQKYRYFIRPVDYYGNPGDASDTATAVSTNMRAVALPEKIRVESHDSPAGLMITWSNPEPGMIRSVRIFRSTNYNSGYAQIGEVDNRTTGFTDENVVPMTKYYYYLTNIGPFGELSPGSARVAGIYENMRAPLPPVILQSEGVTNGVRLRITTTDRSIAGYRISRGNGFGEPMHVITALVPRTDSIISFTDTDTSLTGRLNYSYAVRAENTSHVISLFSDTVYVRPAIPTLPPAPLGLRGTTDDHRTQLYWTDMRTFEPALRGYAVYRRELAGEKPAAFRVIGSELPATVTTWVDSTVDEGKSYEYALKAFDIFGGTSVQSQAVAVSFPVLKPIPPAALRAQSEKGSVIITWDQTVQENLTGYRVYRYESGMKPVALKTLAPAATSYTDASVKHGTLYFYFITALGRKNAESTASPEISIRP
jgi:fibronectin type 3 domain-containing protein